MAAERFLKSVFKGKGGYLMDEKSIYDRISGGNDEYLLTIPLNLN